MSAAGERACHFIEQHCVNTVGDYYREPFTLLSWQREWLHELFRENEDGKRVYKRALLGVPKGNGKTELIAAIGLYLLVSDQATPDIVCAASKTAQGKLIWNAASIMVEESIYSRSGKAGGPTLADVLKVSAKEITCSLNRGRLRVLAGDSASIDSDDGGNFSAVLIDELHAWNKPKSRLMWTTLTGGVVKRAEGLVVQITTAGALNDELLWMQEYEAGRAVADGEVDDPEYFFQWYSADKIEKDEDYRDYNVAKRANPSLDEHLTWSSLQSQQRMKTRAEYLRFHLNIATKVDEAWLEEGQWDSCRSGLAPKKHESIYVAADASKNNDKTSIAFAQWQGRRLVVRQKTWTPPRDPRDPKKPLAGYHIPQSELLAHIMGLSRDYKIETVAYDPAFFTLIANELSDRGLTVVEFPQSEMRMSLATMGMRTLIMEGILAHDGDPELSSHVGNVVPRQVSTDAERTRMSKGLSRGRIDAAVAVAIATRMATSTEEEEAPVTPGIRLL